MRKRKMKVTIEIYYPETDNKLCSMRDFNIGKMTYSRRLEVLNEINKLVDSYRERN